LNASGGKLHIAGTAGASANFEFEGPITEAVLLGNVALRTGKKLYWDGPAMKVTNSADAQHYVRAEYRQGWTL
jgi:hypothetical protein